MVDFKVSQFPKDVILYAVWFYVRFPVSYRDLEEIMAERGGEVDFATLNRWLEKYSEQIGSEAQKRKAQPARSWRMDETYIKVKGRWCYLYRAVNKFGNTLDFMLSETRDEEAATRFFARTIRNNGGPDRVVCEFALNCKNVAVFFGRWHLILESRCHCALINQNWA